MATNGKSTGQNAPTKVADLPTREVADAKAGQVKGGAKRPIQPCI
jgi:hypothetical protein